MEYTTGLNTSSAIINSQLVPQTKTQWYTPFAVGPIIQGVPASPPQSPPGYAGADGGASRVDSAHPFSLTGSPVPWLIGMFVAGYVLMRYVHWGY